MISAAQVREALALLGWTVPTLAGRAVLTFEEMAMALDDVGIRRLGGLQLGAIREALDEACVGFVSKDDGFSSRLRQPLP